MRIFLFLMLLVVSYSVLAEQDSAYLIIKSTAPEGEKQPTWIGMSRNGHLVHIPADKEIVKIKPGKYRIFHIDFNESVHLGKGSQSFKDPPVFDFKSGGIYFIGDIRLSKKTIWRNELEIIQDSSHIIAACKSSPEVFEKYPLTTTKGVKKVKIMCNAKDNS